MKTKGEAMGEKIEELKESAEDFAMDHQGVLYGVGWVIGMVSIIPVCYLAYKWQAKIIGKEVAKALDK